MRSALRARNALEASGHALRHLDGTTKNEVVWRSGPVTPRRYEGRGADRATTPLLLVPPIINRYRVVDLQAGMSLVESLVERGITTLVLDWGDPRSIDRGIDFEDYVLRWIPRAIEASGAEQVDLLGYCLGGTIAVMAAARHSARVRRLVTLHAPVDFGCERPHMDLLRLWVDPQWFPVERLTKAFGNMPGWLVAQGFTWQRPLDAFMKPWRTWERLDDADRARYTAVLESWNQDGVDIPGAAYRRLIKELYRENRLAQGTFELRGERVLLSRIACPVLVVTAIDDTTCPPEAAAALLARVSTPETGKKHHQVKGGHVASVAGPKARASLHQPIAEWLCA